MKFERSNLSLVKDGDVKVAPAVTETEVDLDVLKTESKVGAEEVIDVEVEKVVSSADELKSKESMEEKFKIPEFDLNAVIRECVQQTAVGCGTAEDAKGVGLADVVPEAAGEDEVVESTDSILEPSEPELTGDCGKCGVSEPLCTCEEAPIEEAVHHVDKSEVDSVEQPEEVKKEDDLTKQVSWDKFVDFVITPTLSTCIDRVKDFITTVLSEDLKKIDPDM